MASLLDRVGTLISANVNWLISQAMKANSMAIVDEYIRRVEDHLEALEDAAATVGGEVKTLKRKHDEYQAKADELDRNIDLFLQQNKEDLAVAAQSRYNMYKRMADSYHQQYEAQDAEYQKLLDAKLKLEAKLTSVKQEREELQALLDLARSKEMTAKTIKSLDDLMGAGDADVARVAEGIRARLDKASARGEMMAESLDVQMDQVLEKSALEAQLAERKSRLGLG